MIARAKVSHRSERRIHIFRDYSNSYVTCKQEQTSIAIVVDPHHVRHCGIAQIETLSSDGGQWRVWRFGYEFLANQNKHPLSRLHFTRGQMRGNH
jgi:hypothetical protein